MDRSRAPARRRSRRRFLRGAAALAALGLLSGCGSATRFGQAAKAPVVGFLALGPREGRAPLIAGFIQGMQDLGYREGQSFTIEYRFAERNDRLPDLAVELVGEKVDCILASGVPASLAAKQATTTIPIVMGGSSDPVATGIVASLAQPGGNVTGMSHLGPQTSGKRLELLRQIIPGLSRLALILNQTNPVHVIQEQEIIASALVLGIQIQVLRVRTADDFEGVLRAAASAGADAVYPVSDATVTNARQQFAELALRYRLPSVFDFRENVAAGGLVSFGPVLADLYRRSAAYVDRILKGAKPADLPIEQPTTFEIFINLRTAQALGLTIPPSVLEHATEVIQ